jgi:tetratricopeptide (TPR) repeat protein
MAIGHGHRGLAAVALAVLIECAARAAAPAACRPALSELDVAHGFAFARDCGMPPRLASRFAAAANRAARQAGLATDQRAAYAVAVNVLLQTVPAHAIENLVPRLAALAGLGDRDFATQAQAWRVHYRALLAGTALVSTSDPLERTIDAAIARGDLDRAAAALGEALAETPVPEPVAAARRLQAALIEWLRFEPERAVAHARYAHALAPDDLEIAAVYAELLDATQRREEAQRLYDGLLARYQVLAQDKPDIWRPRVAVLLMRTGRLYAALRLPQDAETAFMHALGIEWRLSRAAPAVYAPLVVQAFDALGVLYRDERRFDDAIVVSREALALERALAAGDAAAYEPALASTLNDLGVLYDLVRRMPEALESFGEALSIERRLVLANPATASPMLARTLSNLGNALSDARRLSDAEQAYTEALAIRRTLARESEAVHGAEVARTLNNLGVLYRMQGRMGASLGAYRSALRIFRTLAAAAPLSYRADEARTLNNLGVLYGAMQHPHAAERAYRRAIACYAALAKVEPTAYRSDYARVLDNLARLFNDTGRTQEAESLRRDAAGLVAAARGR